MVAILSLPGDDVTAVVQQWVGDAAASFNVTSDRT